MKKISISCLLLFCTWFAKGQDIPSWKMTDLVDFYSRKTDSVYVINFWATFCKPCIAEIPYLESISKKFEMNKVTLLLVSLDLPAFYPALIEKFAIKNNFTSNKIWLNESDADYFCPMIDKKWSGSIPATLFVNAATGYRNFIENEMSPAVFETELKKAIGSYR